jgi:hypothetical protein
MRRAARQTWQGVKPMRAFLSRMGRNTKSNVTLVEYILIITMAIPIANAGASTLLDKLH